MSSYENTSPNEKFWAYLAEKLNRVQWDGLQGILKCSPHRLTKLQNGSNDFSFSEIEAIAKMLGENPAQLAYNWKLGTRSNSLAAYTAFASRHDQNLLIALSAA